MAVDKRIEDLLSRILNPDDLGLAASPELRDTIRFALGRAPIESNLIAYFALSPTASKMSMLAQYEATESLVADWIDAARSRISSLAVEARADYSQALTAGGEPTYPQWTDDVFAALGIGHPKTVAPIFHIPQPAGRTV